MNLFKEVIRCGQKYQCEVHHWQRKFNQFVFYIFNKIYSNQIQF